MQQSNNATKDFKIIFQFNKIHIILGDGVMSKKVLMNVNLRVFTEKLISKTAKKA